MRGAAAAGALAACGALAFGCRGGLGHPRPADQASRSAPVQRVAPSFSGTSAMELLKAQCDFGPRVPGTAAHRRGREWMTAELKKTAHEVIVQEFRYRQFTLANIVGRFNTRARRQVLLCAHWDSRPTADMEIVEAKRRMPIPGANDGASGVAVLLQLARMFREKPPSIGVIIVLLDGEDYGDFVRDEGVFLGSRYFAANMRKFATPEYGILLDMVGDRDLRIYREAISERRARRINSLVFSTARELGYGRTFVDQVGEAITDDHIPINDAGVPCIDLIDFDYGPWHTLDDTPDKCSAESLRIVGEVIAEVVYREKDRP